LKVLVVDENYQAVGCPPCEKVGEVLQLAWLAFEFDKLLYPLSNAFILSLSSFIAVASILILQFNQEENRSA
jgi:hypothetical protein